MIHKLVDAIVHVTECLLELRINRGCECHLPDDTPISRIIEKYWEFKDMTTLNGHAYNFSLVGRISDTLFHLHN